MLASTSAVAQITGASGVDGRVAGEHPHVGGAQVGAQGEELLRHQRLDRCGVEAAPAGGQGRDVGAEGDEALARPGRGGDDDVAPGEDLEQRLLLGRVQGQAPLLGPGDEPLQGLVRILGLGADLGETAVTAGAGMRSPSCRIECTSWFAGGFCVWRRLGVGVGALASGRPGPAGAGRLGGGVGPSPSGHVPPPTALRADLDLALLLADGPTRSPWRGSGARPPRRDQGRPDPGQRGADRPSRPPCATPSPSTPGRRVARRGVRGDRSGTGAGSSTPSTAPRTSCGACRSGRPSSLCRWTRPRSSGSSPPPHWAAAGGPRRGEGLPDCRPRRSCAPAGSRRSRPSATPTSPTPASTAGPNGGGGGIHGLLGQVLRAAVRSATSGPTCWWPRAPSTCRAGPRRPLGHRGAPGHRRGGRRPLLRPRR